MATAPASASLAGMVVETPIQPDALQETSLRTSASAASVLRLAVSVLGLGERASASDRGELLRVSRVFAGEGRLVLAMAEEIASELLSR